jgi:hypothetical protein
VKDGKRHGQGKLTNSGGQIYDGNWKDGQRHGVGKLFYNEEQTIVYTGEWYKNNRHGYGVMRYASGNTFEGYWQNDRKHGFGVMIWRDMDETYIGEWIDDQPNGFGEHIWGDSNAKTVKKQTCNMYRGQFLHGKRHGRGTFFYMNGASYAGFWQDDSKHGSGVFLHPDGKMAVGDYDMNRLVTVRTANTAALSPTPTVATTSNANNTNKITSGNADCAISNSKTTSGSKPGTPSANLTSQKNSTAAPRIATKLPTIRENASTSSINNGMNSNLPVPPPGTANANAGPAHPNNISVQYHLHILDILAKFPAHPRLLDFDHHSPSGMAAMRGAAHTVNGAVTSSVSMTMGDTVRGGVDYAKTVHERSVAMHEMERLLLKYNTHLKTVYHRFNEQSNRLRQREIVIIPPLKEGVSPYSLEEKTWKLRKAALTARAFHRRVHCISLREAIQFLREMELLNGQEMTAYDVVQIFRSMKRHHERCAMDLYRDYLKQLQTLEDEAAMLELEAVQVAAEQSNAFGDSSIRGGKRQFPSTQSLELMNPSMLVENIESEEEYTARHRREQHAKAVAIRDKIHDAHIAIGRLLDDYLLFFDDEQCDNDASSSSSSSSEEEEDKGEDPFPFQAFPSSSSSPAAAAALSFYRLGLGQQPLLEHEFIELFVRVVLEFALRHGYDPSKHDTVTGDGTKEVCWAWMTPCQIVEKILAERLFPLANRSYELNDFVQDIYDEHVQDLFHQRANKLLDSAFSPSSLSSLQLQTSAEELGAENATDLKDSAQKAMMAQWESLKQFAIDQRNLNDSEMYPVSGTGSAGWVRVGDFVEWFVRNSTVDAFGMPQHNYASLQANIGTKELLRLLTVHARSVPTALVLPSKSNANESVEENKESNRTSLREEAVAEQRDNWQADDTLTERKMIYEDFVDALVRIWTQNEQIVRITNPLFASQKPQLDADIPAEGMEVNNAQADIGSIEGDMQNAGIGGWLDVGSHLSSSVLNNQLLNRLLLWLLSQRLRGVSNSNLSAASNVVTN